MEISGAARIGTNWKLNDSLIQDPDTAERVEQALKIYFEINDTKEISRATLWGAHKAYIRGVLISIGAGKKRERRKKMSLLYKEIQELEQGTRPRVIPDRQTLIGKKREFEDLLEQERKCAFDFINKEKYQGGNKSGKWLVRRVKEKKNKTFIPKIRNEGGGLEFFSPKIAEVFHSYYSTLYRVGRKEEGERRILGSICGA